MKTSELIGPALDWAVARALGKTELKPLKDAETNGRLPYDFDLCFDIHNWEDVLDIMHGKPSRCDCNPIELMDFARKLGFYILHKTKEAPYSTTWALGGPIIEQEGCFPIQAICRDSKFPNFDFLAKKNHHDIMERPSYGPTALIAAMRCYVASKLGDIVKLPEGLT